jgi:hypothetical protein
MKSNLLLSVSALTMFAAGLALSLLPQEALVAVGAAPAPLQVLLLQVTGALYLGFGMLNWMNRGNLVGGIYARPLVVGNLLHFAAVAIAVLKLVTVGERTPAVLVGGAVYVVLALGFARALLTSPVAAKE